MNYNLSTTGSMGVTAAAFAASITRALSTTTLVYEGYPVYANVPVTAGLGINGVPKTPSFIRALSMPPPSQQYVYPPGQYEWIYPNSIGVSATAFTPAINRALYMALVYSGYPLYEYISSGSLGVEPSGNFKVATNRALYDVSSTGINPRLFIPLVTRAISGSNSLGITETGQPASNRAVASSASLGVTGFARISRVYKIASVGSLGVSATVTPAMIRAAISSGSIGITLAGRMSLSRALKTLASMGITGTVIILASPSANQPNVIILFEATDTSNPTTFGALLPRDYTRIYLDQTTSSYPKPFALLN